MITGSEMMMTVTISFLLAFQFLAVALAAQNVKIDWAVPLSANGSINSLDSIHHDLVVGDSIVFEYNPSYHNVLSVSESAFAACNISQPLQVFGGGNTVITFDRTGSWWFICGFGNHCQAGQALKFTVNDNDDSFLSTSPAPVAVPGSPLNPEKAVAHMAEFADGCHLKVYIFCIY